MGLFDDLVQPETKKTGIFSDLVGSTAVADPPMQAGGMDFDLSQFKDAPVMPPEVQGVDMARDSLLKRAAKNVYGEMTNVLKPDLPPIREIGQRNQLAEERAARESGGDPDTFFALREKYMNEYQARLTQGSGYIPQVAPPQSPGEFGVDIPTKIIPMLTKIVIMQRLGIPAPLAWEFENLTGGGAPGKGVAMQGILKGAEGLKLHPALKPAVPGGIFATEAAMAGGGPAEIATAFLIPYALKTLELPKYAGDKLRAKGRANIINNMRKMLRDKKIDDSKIPDEALGAILDAAKKQKVWDKALRNKKITPETHIKRTAEVADSLVPIFAAIGRTQTVQPKPQEPLRIRPTRVVNEKSPGFGGGLNALPAEATMDKTPVMPRVSVKPDTSVGLRDRVAGDNFTMGAPTLVTPVSPQTELQNKVRGLVLQAAEGGRKGAGAQRKLDSLVNSNPALKEDADRLLYDALIEKAGSGDTKAVDKLQNEPKPTYDELLEKAYNGDPSAIGMIQRGEYREPASKPVEGKVAGVEQTTQQGETQGAVQVGDTVVFNGQEYGVVDVTTEAGNELKLEKKKLTDDEIHLQAVSAVFAQNRDYAEGMTQGEIEKEFPSQIRAAESDIKAAEGTRKSSTFSVGINDIETPQAGAQAVKQPWEMETSEFIKDTEVGSRSNKTDEPSPNKYKEGDFSDLSPDALNQAMEHQSTEILFSETSPLDETQKAQYDKLLEEANRGRMATYRHVFKNMPEAHGQLEKAWNRARKNIQDMADEAGIEITLPTWEEKAGKLSGHGGGASRHPKLNVIGLKRIPTVDRSDITMMKRSPFYVNRTEVVYTKDSISPTESEAKRDLGDKLYDKAKEKNYEYVVDERVYPYQGRIRIETFADGFDRDGILAHARGHIGLRYVRARGGELLEAVQAWYAERLNAGHSSRHLKEMFARAYAMEARDMRSTLPKEVVDAINALETADIPDDIYEKMVADWDNPDYSIGKDRKRAGFARLPSDILDKLPKSLQDKITKQKKSRGGFADFSELYDVYKKAKGDKPQQRKAREEIAEATTNAIKVAKAVPKFLLAGIEPSKLVEMKHGKQVYADVLKGTFGKAEKRLIEFEEKELTDLDGRVDELYEWFDQYPKSDLRNFMLSRGKPWTKEGKQLKDEATQNLPPEMTHSSLYKAINEIADRNYDFLTAVAGDNIEYVNDYFYGIFKNNDQVDKFLGFYKTTTRFTKEKKLPTVADAVAYGLELRNYNPVSNLRAEWSGIARLEGMVWLREELLKNGFGKYIDNSVAAPIEWKRIANGTEPVFKDFRVEPDLARMINNLIATNLVTANKGLSTLREINNVLRTIKFAGSVFHALVEASQAVADNPYLNPARKSSAAGLTFGFKKSDPIFKTPQYKEYIKLGGGHKYSAESQAVAAMDRLLRGLSHLPVIRIVGRPAAKVANLPVPPMPGFSKWMFDKWIPKIKYTKYLDEVMRQEKKLGRQLTEGEKIDIIKEGQNFYGEMNERLFGRSSTLTSVLRFFFLAPGFAEGNYRTEAKGAAQWGYKGGHRASRSRANMVNSLMIKAIIASIGTAIMTSKLPKRPKSMEDVKDIWKINTGLKDEHDREILIDTLTYDKDYANFLISLAQGRPDKVVTEGFRRLGGMKAPLFDIATDMAQLAMGKALYDWKGDRVIEITDPFLKAANKLAAYEFLKLEPIPVSVFKQARQKELSVAAAAIQSFSGVRPTYSEKDLREKKMLHKIYSLKGQQEELYQYLRTLKNPRKAISDYNATIEDVLSSKFIPQEMKDKWSPTLFVDTDRLLKNKKESYQSASHTLQEAEWIRDFIANFDEQAPPSLWDAGGTLPERLGSFVEYRRALNRQKESLTGKKMSLSKGLDAIQLKLTKLSKALAVTKDAKRQKIYINQAELLLDHADALRRDSQ